MTREKYEQDYSVQLCAFTRYLKLDHPDKAMDHSEARRTGEATGRTFSEWIYDMHEEFEAETGLSAKWDCRQLHKWFDTLCR